MNDHIKNQQQIFDSIENKMDELFKRERVELESQSRHSQIDLDGLLEDLRKSKKKMEKIDSNTTRNMNDANEKIHDVIKKIQMEVSRVKSAQHDLKSDIEECNREIKLHKTDMFLKTNDCSLQCKDVQEL